MHYWTEALSMIDRVERDIFAKGSTTYYWSSKFFPVAVRSDVFKLYSFVRVADDYVDHLPQRKRAFYALRQAWDKAYADPLFDTGPQADEPLADRVVKNMIYVSRKHAFDPAWIEAFLDAMQSDLEGTEYKTLNDTIVYMHGSAEVVGLMMCKIMDINPAAYEAAKLQGRAMQYINFIRDVAEDNRLGRSYIPQEELDVYKLADLSHQTAVAHPRAFKKCIQAQIAYYRAWQAEAEKGYAYLPKRLKVPVITAARMYDWTATQIEKDPLQIYSHKIKPTRQRVLAAALRSAASS